MLNLNRRIFDLICLSMINENIHVCYLNMLKETFFILLDWCSKGRNAEVEKKKKPLWKSQTTGEESIESQMEKIAG